MSKKNIICMKTDMDEMPAICNHCDLRFDCKYEDAWQGLPDSDQRPDNCPLISLNVEMIIRDTQRKKLEQKLAGRKRTERSTESDWPAPNDII